MADKKGMGEKEQVGTKYQGLAIWRGPRAAGVNSLLGWACHVPALCGANGASAPQAALGGPATRYHTRGFKFFSVLLKGNHGNFLSKKEPHSLMGLYTSRIKIVLGDWVCVWPQVK